MNLDPFAADAGVRVMFHARVGSTNSEGLALARAGERGPCWVVASEQTAGRGRRGRHWHSPPGNLYASLLLTEPCAPEKASQLSFVAALGVFDALAETNSSLGKRLRFKWPNDLLLREAKVAGLLVEGESLADRRLATVIGIGINCCSHPDATPYPATDFRAAGFDVEPEGLFQALARTMPLRLRQWARGEGFAHVRQEWLAHAAPVGEPLRLRIGETEIAGRFEGIDIGGRLALTLADGSRQMFHAAEVLPGLDRLEELRAGAAL